MEVIFVQAYLASLATLAIMFWGFGKLDEKKAELIKRRIRSEKRIELLKEIGRQ